MRILNMKAAHDQAKADIQFGLIFATYYQLVDFHVRVHTTSFRRKLQKSFSFSYSPLKTTISD